MESMQKYNFYFDEAFHTRNITNKTQKINLKADEVQDFYLGCFLGIPQSTQHLLTRDVTALEEEFKSNRGISNELKSKYFGTIPKMENGIASLKDDSVVFYAKLFELLRTYDVKIQLFVANKYQFLLSQCFPQPEWFYRFKYPYDIFMNWLTNFIVLNPQYNIAELLMSYKNTKYKVKQMNSILSQHQQNILRQSYRQKEWRAIEFIKTILQNPNIYLFNATSFSWKYDSMAEAFYNYICIGKYEYNNIVVDEEAKTLSVLQRKFPTARSGKSHDIIELRMCDWVAGLLSKTMLRLEDALRNAHLHSNGQHSKLPESFFKLSEAQQTCVVEMAKFLCENQTQGALSTTTYRVSAQLLNTFISYIYICNTQNKQPSSDEFTYCFIKDHQQYCHQLMQDEWFVCHEVMH